MTKMRFGLVFTFCSLLAFTSCNRDYQKVVKSTDMDAKYDKAKEYYNEGDCFKAIPLFEEIITYYKGSRELEDIYFSYAYCHFAQEEFIVAAYHFNRFAQLYPRSEKVVEAAFMVAKCNHQQSPKYTLDQTATYEAINQYQKFVEKYPNSEKVNDANIAIDELRAKLQMKAIAGAKLYFKIKDYQAAATTFKNLIEEFPESKDIEESYYYIVLSNKLLADNSYEVKKKERYEETIKSFNTFKQKFPTSKYLAELEKINKESTQFVNQEKIIIQDELKKQRGS
jgi:outer membrane protein assembly factor BamD